ncbi:MAG TPA: hypothetical protein VHE30_22555 [Polyangiaceae bacterium]|nr:hypothetical protein [Polyangiaceae bacterium]
MLSATDFGCIPYDPNNTPSSPTPCTQQMQAFLNAVRGGEGYLPPGVYYVDEELYYGYDCSPGVDAGAQPDRNSLGGRLCGAGMANTIIRWAGADNDGSAILRVSNPRCHISGIQLFARAKVAGNAPQASTGIVFQDAERATLDQVWVRATADGSLTDLTDGRAGFLWDTTWHGATGPASNEAMRLTCCEAGGCWKGYFVARNGLADSTTFRVCVALGNGFHGFHLFGTGLAMYSCKTEGNGGHGVRIGIGGPGVPRSSGCSIYGVHVEGNIANATLAMPAGEKLYGVYFDNADGNLIVGGTGHFLDGDFIGTSDGLHNVVLYGDVGARVLVPGQADASSRTKAGREFRFRPEDRKIIWVDLEGSATNEVLDFADLPCGL